MDNLSEIMFIETRTTSYAVIHFANFIKLDIFVYNKSDLMPSVWMQNMLIIFDKEGFLNELKNKAKELVYLITQNEFDELISKYFAFFHELYRRKERSCHFMVYRTKLRNVQLKYLDKWIPVLIEKIESFMRSINKEILKVIEQISKYYHLSFNKKQFIMITSKII